MVKSKFDAPKSAPAAKRKSEVASQAADREVLEQAPLLARLSLTRPIFITSLVLASLLIGLLSYLKLGVDLFPEIEIPVVSVVVPYRGAGPSEIETLVVKPLEEELSTLGGIKRVLSSCNDGYGSIVCQFYSDTDMKNAEQQVRNRVANVRGKLPREIDEPIINRVNLSDQPIIELGLEGELPPAELYDLAKEEIKNRLAQVPGVGKVDLLGGRRREIQVLLDRAQLKDKALSAGLVVGRIADNSSNVPVGKVTKGEKELSFRTLGEYRSLEQIENAVVSFYDRPVRVRDIAQVKDALEDPSSLAFVNGRPAIIFKVFKQTGTNTVEVVDGVLRALEKINAEIKERAGKPQLSSLRDGATWIRSNVADVKETIAIGILLVLVVVYFFLGNFRSTFITGLALPNSLLGAFILMNLAGFTINLMTLLALSLAVGLLIDDAIVVRENIFRHIERGESPWRAALQGTKEVNLAVIATSAVVIAVFLPVGFLSGTVGKFLGQFGLTMCFAMAISLFDALTIAPMLSAYFAGEGQEEKGGAFHWGGVLVGALGNGAVGAVVTHGKPGPVAASMVVGGILGGLAPMGVRPFERFQEWLEARYKATITWVAEKDYLGEAQRGLYERLRGLFILAGRILAGLLVLLALFLAWKFHARPVPALLGLACLGGLAFLLYRQVAGAAAWLAHELFRARFWTLAAATLVFLGSFVAAAFVTKTFIPQSDTTEFMTQLELPEGSSLEQTAAVARQMMETVRRWPEVQNTALSVEGNKATLFAGLKPAKQRSKSSQDVKTEVRAALAEQFKQYKTTVGDYDPVGAGEKPFTLVLKGDDLGVLAAFAEQLKERLKTKVPGLVDLDSNYRAGKPEYQVKLDPLKAGRLGVSTVTAGQELRILTDGAVAGKYRDNGREYDIRVRLREEQRDLEKGYNATWVPNLNHTLVRLASVASAQRANGPSTISRRDRSRSVIITANLAQGAGLGSVLDAARKVLKDPAHPLPAGVSWDFVGQAEDFADLARNMLIAVVLAILIMYLVLASLYESFVTPLTIMLALPPAIAGAFYALAGVEWLSKAGVFAFLNRWHLFHVNRLEASINLFSLIGLVMLLGLVAKNSILLVDLALERIRGGRERAKAVVEAGVARLRPILMTSLALFFGTLPLALALNEAARFRSSMGVAIAGGLFSSTLLTLVVVPAAFEYIDDFRQWFEGLFRRLGRRS